MLAVATTQRMTTKATGPKTSSYRVLGSRRAIRFARTMKVHKA